MGAGGSKTQAITQTRSHAIPGICITLDAFGTLYRPRSPIPAQYRQLASHVGLTITAADAELGASFKSAFKAVYSQHPNYGYSSSMKPEEWWRRIVVETIKPHLRGDQQIPKTLIPLLYSHFSGKDAYELYPDVLPFFQHLRALKEKYRNATDEGPLFMTGVISNSDDRVHSILRDLGLKCTECWPISPQSKLTLAADPEARTRVLQSKSKNMQRKWSVDASTHTPNKEPPFVNGLITDLGEKYGIFADWDLKSDIDFVLTSYECGSEKPDYIAFDMARWAKTQGLVNRYFELSKPPAPDSPTCSIGWDRFREEYGKRFRQGSKIYMIHVGDDAARDYQGARDFAAKIQEEDEPIVQGFHLCRGRNESQEQESQISSLEELSAIVTTFAEANFEKPSR